LEWIQIEGGKETDPLVAALEAADWEGCEVTDGAGTKRVEVVAGIDSHLDHVNT